MRKLFSFTYAALALLALGGIAIAQGVSSGGAFLPLQDYVVSGSWLFKHVTAPLRFEGATDDAYETTFVVTDPTADRTITFPNQSGTVPTTEAATTVTGRWFVRDDFDQGYIVAENDATGLLIKSLTDTDDNVVIGSPLGLITYREEQTKTTSSWLVVDGQLDIKGDNTTTAEGVEIVFGGDGANTNEGVIVAGTSGACFTASVTITDISGAGQFLIGWRQNETWQDAAAYAGYTVWNTVGITATDGSITAKSEVSGATQTDDSNVNTVDGATHIFKSCVSAAGIPTAYYTANGSSTFVQITLTNGGAARTAGIQMYPFLSFLASGTDGPNPLVNWVQLEAAP